MSERPTHGFSGGYLCEVRYTDDPGDERSEQWTKARIEKIAEDGNLHAQVYGGPLVAVHPDSGLVRHLEHDCEAEARKNGTQCPTCGRIHEL